MDTAIYLYCVTEYHNTEEVLKPLRGEEAAKGKISKKAT